MIKSFEDRELRMVELKERIKELGLSRDRYAALYDFAPVGYFSFDAYGVVREVNLTGAHLLGIERGLLVNKPFISLIADAEGRDIFSRHLETVLQKQGVQRCEIRLTGKEGGVIHGLLQSAAVETIDSKEGCILCSIVDGTSREQREENLQQAHNELEIALDERTTELTRANVRLTLESEERERAEKELAERAMLAELSADIGCALTTQEDLRRILNVCAEALVRHLDVAFARIWTLNAAENCLELQASAGMYTRIDGSHSRVPVGDFKIGLIASERKPHITNAVIGDPRVHDQEWAKREGMVAFAGHPLTVEDKLVGVMAMFSRNQLSEVTLKALALVSNEIAIGIERKWAEGERLAHLRFFESMDRVNHAIQGANDLEQLMRDVLDAVLEIFDCDRAWLLYPCDPEAAWWSVPMERTKPEYPGANVQGRVLPMDPEVQRMFRIQRGTDSPVSWGPGSDCSYPEWLTEQFGVQSQLSVSTYPKTGQPWQFGMHQCSHSRVWQPEEQRLFQEINRRLADGLTSLLSYHDLLESETKYRRIVETATEGIWAFGPDNLTTFVNARMAEMLGYSAEEMIGRPLTDFMFEEDASDHMRRMENRRQGLAENYERRFRRKDGEPVWTLASAIPIQDDEHNYKGSFAMFTDVTERKRAEETLHLQTIELENEIKERRNAQYELEKLNESLERHVQERTAELEEKNAELKRFNKLFVNRELKMIELKERIKALENSANEGGGKNGQPTGQRRA